MYDLTTITPEETTELGNALSRLGSGAQSMEEAANRIVSHLYDNLVEKESGQKSCALVRFYKSHPYGELDEGLQQFARGVLGAAPESPDMKCLTQLATVGEQQQWNSRANSAGHKAIPLASEQVIASIPMISRLIQQVGLEVSAVVKPEAAVIGDLAEKTFNTFYVQQAPGSQYIPAQDEFVIPFGIQSVLGFGGILTSGELFVVIMFSKTPIPPHTAEHFRALAPKVKEAVLPFVGGKVFA